jgi:hypothetical protein
MSDWKRLDASDRYLARQQTRGTRGNIIKALAELIKNADDTYDRAKASSGKIEIGYWRLKKTKRRAIAGFYVRDWGQGMGREIAIRAYTRYGEDTSEGGRNAAIGVGGKDALYGMNKCYIFTIRDGVPLVVEIRTNPVHKLLESRILEDQEARSLMETFNAKIVPHASPLNLSKSGTTVAFNIPSEDRGVRIDTIIEGLSNYYTLRRIMSSPDRAAELLDLESGQRKRITYNQLEGEVVYTSPADHGISYKRDFYDVAVEIKKFSGKETLNKQMDMGHGLLVVDERGAVLDNTMAGEDRPAANPFFGTVTIKNWRRLYDVNETVLTDNREGLDYNHEFNQELRRRLQRILKGLADEEEKVSTSTDLDKDLRRRILRAFKRINALIRKEDLGDSADDNGDSIPEGLQFSPQQLAITVEVKRYVQLLFNPEKVPVNSRIALQISEKGVEVSPIDSIVITSTHHDSKVPHVTLTVVGKELGGNAIIKASFGKFEAQAEIIVVPEEELVPNNGFAFIPPTKTIVKSSRKRVRLVIDTRVVLPRSLVILSCDDDRIKILGFTRFLIGSPDLSRYLKEEYIEITGEIPAITGQICARSRTTDGREIETYCTVRIVEKEPPRNFLSDYKLSPSGDERQRATYKDGIVYIHTRAPVLRRYFGDPTNTERLKSRQPDAEVILVDTIVRCVTDEWARARVQRGTVPVLGEPNEEIRRQARILDFEHGKTMHEMILSTIRRGEKSEE